LVVLSLGEKEITIQFPKRRSLREGTRNKNSAGGREGRCIRDLDDKSAPSNVHAKKGGLMGEKKKKDKLGG